MENPKNLERESTIYKAVLNFELKKAMGSWNDQNRTIGYSDNATKSRINTLIDVAKGSGCGFEIKVSKDIALGAEFPGLTEEGRKYLKQGVDGIFTFNLPTREERKKLGKIVLRPEVGRQILSLKSSRGSEAIFIQPYVISFKIV